jgi:hypothetical protein
MYLLTSLEAALLIICLCNLSSPVGNDGWENTSSYIAPPTGIDHKQ